MDGTTHVRLVIGIGTLLLAAAVAPLAAGATDDGELIVDLHADGSATVTLGLGYDLDDDAERDAFESLADDAAERNRTAAAFRDRMRRVAATAASETGREMSVSDSETDLSTDGGVGTVELSVAWEGLAATDGDRLVVARPFAGPSEFDRRLVLIAPSGYETAGVTPEPTERDGASLAWAAGTDLTGFEVVFAPDDGGAGAETGRTDGDRGGDAPTGTNGPGFGVLSVAVAVLAAAALARR